MKDTTCSCRENAAKKNSLNSKEDSIYVCKNANCKTNVYELDEDEKYYQGKSKENYKFSSVTVALCVGLSSLVAIYYLLYTIFNLI
jgi:hypothetical protein